MKTNTEEIIKTALSIFSIKGYEGTLLRDISAALGITKPALYKHFESKEALWNAMIDYVEQYYAEHTQMFAEIQIPADWEEFRTLSMRRILFTLHDETVKNMRKLINIEQYRDSRMTKLATKYFITNMEEHFAVIFAGMQEKDLLKTEDTALLAFRYTAPVTVMIHCVDREPDREAEILQKIEAHIHAFVKEQQR